VSNVGKRVGAFPQQQHTQRPDHTQRSALTHLGDLVQHGASLLLAGHKVERAVGEDQVALLRLETSVEALDAVGKHHVLEGRGGERNLPSDLFSSLPAVEITNSNC
jgi:hypothetical protein